ncbi:uncharacterized protein N7483_008403 [Penicillium malachiteum]|uniref:uncharacterized protein n=1 Tax=Penicillium malachiteum TaxID=1324776 RepID=UPI0025494072|nr:uncharacterized protein N7483_008403 [Penicillium malachiteum]KAJ5720469.1 hypothetical protein N7483_008403 [Penicillium malachiteum]
MPKTRRLLREEITYSKAQREEVDILLRLQYYERQQTFFTRLSDNPESIKAVVAHHLGLSSTDRCQVADVKGWLHGSFNVCIPVTIENWKTDHNPEVEFSFGFLSHIDWAKNSAQEIVTRRFDVKQAHTPSLKRTALMFLIRDSTALLLQMESLYYIL